MRTIVCLLLTVTLFGCGPTVTGEFYDEDGGLVYAGPVSKDQEIFSPGGSDAVAKGVKPEDVVITQLDEAKAPELKKGEAGIGLVIGAGATAGILGIWATLAGIDDHSVKFHVPPLTTPKTRVSVGDDFTFTLTGGPAVEGEGEGEGQIEGEGEGQIEGEGEGQEEVAVPNLAGLTENQAKDAINTTCLKVGAVVKVFSDNIPAGKIVDWSPKGTVPCGTSINLDVSKGPEVTEDLTIFLNSPLDGAVFPLVGSPLSATVTVSADINGPNDEVEVIMVSPEGEVYKKTIVPPKTVSHDFTLTLNGAGLFSVRAKNLTTGEVAERTASVSIQ